MREKIQHIYFPLSLFALNVILIFIHLTATPICWDEPFSIYHAQFKINDIIKQLISGNNPPLFEIILHFWIKFFGISPISVRTLPALFACITPVALYFFVRKNFTLKTAVISSLLLSFSDLHLYYAHDCRVYSLFVLLTILSFYYFFEIINSNNLSSKILFILFTTLLIYGHYFGFFILCFQALYLLFFIRKNLLSIFINYLTVFILYFPYIIVVITRFTKSSNGTWLPPPSGVNKIYNMLWAFSNEPLVTVLCIVILIASLIKYIIQKPKIESKTILVIYWFLIPLLGMFILSYWIPMYIPRYLIFALPSYYILLSICLEYLFKKVLFQNISALILITAFMFSHKLTDSKQHLMVNAVDFMKGHKAPKTLVLIDISQEFLPLAAYHYNSAFFSSVSDGKEYHLTDSLMKADNFYAGWQYKTDELFTKKYDTVIYLTTNLSNKMFPKIKETFPVQKESKINDEYFEVIFTR